MYKERTRNCDFQEVPEVTPLPMCCTNPRLDLQTLWQVQWASETCDVSYEIERKTFCDARYDATNRIKSHRSELTERRVEESFLHREIQTVRSTYPNWI